MEERKIIAYKSYYKDFLATLNDAEKKKVHYVLNVLKKEPKLSAKFVKLVKDGVYELRIEINSNIYRIFFIFDEGNIVVLFHGFQKKTQKTPQSEIEKALKIKKEYYAEKNGDL